MNVFTCKPVLSLCFSQLTCVQKTMMDSSTESSLLYAARNGDIETVKSLVMALKDNRLSFDLNCTGMYKYTIVF